MDISVQIEQGIEHMDISVQIDQGIELGLCADFELIILIIG